MRGKNNGFPEFRARTDEAVCAPIVSLLQNPFSPNVEKDVQNVLKKSTGVHFLHFSTGAFVPKLLNN